jgi:hypothetical protein
VPHDPVPDPPLWYQVFQEFMCRLYRTFGGDCQDLDWGDAGTTALQTVRAEFEAQGPPEFETQEEADAFLSTIEALEAHLGSPNATITQEVSSGVQDLIDEIRAALVL